MKRTILISAREAKGMTQQDVAKVSGITRSYYGLIENGVRNPTLKIALKIAEALDLTIEEAFPGVIFFGGRGYDMKQKEGDDETSATKETA